MTGLYVMLFMLYIMRALTIDICEHNSCMPMHRPFVSCRHVIFFIFKAFYVHSFTTVLHVVYNMSLLLCILYSQWHVFIIYN